MESITLFRAKIVSFLTRVASFAACSLTVGRSATNSSPVCTRGSGMVHQVRFASVSGSREAEFPANIPVAC